MVTFTIRGIPISFPFEPYEIQKDYMEKVIECLQNETNSILESPTGTGKTLSLLCSTLAWLTAKKAQMQAERFTGAWNEPGEGESNNSFLMKLQEDLNEKVGTLDQNGRAFLGVPTIIYASRTHSQLSQAMQELKRTAYAHMKATVIGSREQLCIHPEIVKEESNVTKVHMCQLKVHSRSCHFYNRVEKLKDDMILKNSPVIDIEDLVSLGGKHSFCPYFMSKELKKHADIIFMPYNYLLDAIAQKALGITLANTVVIIDEAHNIEKICEEAASAQLKSTDITLCIDEVTDVMKAMSENATDFVSDDAPKDFTPDELCILKQLLLNLETTVDELPLDKPDGVTMPGDCIYEILNKSGICFENSRIISGLIEKIIQFLSTSRQSPFQRKGNGLSLLDSLIRIVYASPSPEYREKIKGCCKLFLIKEEAKKKQGTDWLSKSTSSVSKPGAKIINFWCFNPGFGLNSIMELGIRSLILTSGTLAPLKPLITELDLDADVLLENPHIVKQNQVCVKILNKGPDGVDLNSNFQNRNNPQYIASLGRTILNLSRIIPDGLLIFFPSYPIMQKCQQEWQQNGIWGNISDQKAIYVEPKQKEAFNTAMNEFYSRIQNPEYKGAIFMGVCRGKISEGLDFADSNGRGVVIIGLPYPPFKDPRVVLKREYLDLRRTKVKELISGGEWYSLEATRAVNQAIGRVIRHKDDYGAIILLDARFSNFSIKSQLSKWLRERIQLVNNFGEIVRDLRNFYRSAEANLPQPKLKPLRSIQNSVPTEFENSQVYRRKGNFDFSTSGSCSSLSGDSSSGLVAIHNRNTTSDTSQGSGGVKRKRIKIVKPNVTTSETKVETTPQEFIAMAKSALTNEDFKKLVMALKDYRNTKNFEELTLKLDSIFIEKPNVRYIIEGLQPFFEKYDKEKFEIYWQKMK